MRRPLSAATGLALAASLLVWPVSAGRPWSGPEFREFQRDYDQPVEQQTPGGALQPDHSLWVTNPGPCFWDPDDRLEAQLYGRWSRGQTVTHTECVFGDWAGHLLALNTSNDFTVTIALDGVTVASGTGMACWQGPDYDRADPQLVPIPGSDGGVALRQEISYSVTALRQVPRGGVFVRLGLPSSGFLEAWCP